MSTKFIPGITVLSDFTQISSSVSTTSNIFSDGEINLICGNITADGSELKGIHVKPNSGDVVIDGSLTVIGGGGTVAGVSQIIPGTNTTISSTGPSGTGVVTINATGGTPSVNQLIAGTNVTLSPSNGLGVVTINATGGVPPVTQLIAGTNVTLSPSNGLGVVTINATGGGGGGGVSSVTGTSAITINGTAGGSSTTTPVIGLANTPVTPGIYFGDSSVFTINGPGQITNVANGAPSIFNVKTYGAQCNGTTDDTTAIQSAITACIAAGGGTVFFPSGISLITSTLNVTSSCRFLGGNRITCGIAQNNTSYNIFTITSSVYVSSFSMYYNNIPTLSNNTLYIDDPLYISTSGPVFTFVDPYSVQFNILINGFKQSSITSPYTINPITFSLTTGNNYSVTINSVRHFEVESKSIIYTA